MSLRSIATMPMLRLACAAIAGATSASAGNLTFAFEDVTTPALQDEDFGSRGASWIDFDDDGWQDLYFTNWDGPNRLFRNLEGTGFQEITDTIGPFQNPADLNNDDIVNAIDLSRVLGDWGSIPPSIGDISNDGVVNATDLSRLLGAWGTGTPPPPLKELGDGLSGQSIWADYDNDGDLDAFICQSLGSVLLRNDNNTNFINMTAGDLVPLQQKLVRSSGWADFNSDGLLDLYVSGSLGSDESSRLLLQQPDGTFEDVTEPNMADPGVGRGVAWIDYDNDGDLDLYLVNGNPGNFMNPKANRLYRYEGPGRFTTIDDPPLNNAGNGRGSAWGDFDNDGDLDCYLANLNVATIGGANVLARNNGDGTFTDISTGLLGEDLQSRDCSWADIDNDGDLDLFVLNAFGVNRTFRNDNGTLNPTSDNDPITEDTQGARSGAWADYDRDGDLDLFITTAGTNLLLRNETRQTNRWIQIKLIGTTSNRSAIGAKITTYIGPKLQTRTVQSGSGYMTMHQLTQHFGLGPDRTIDIIEIAWPSGITQRLENIEANQFLTITEPAP